MPESGPVRLDFSDIRSLAYLGLKDLVASRSFEMEQTANAVVFTRQTDSGLVFERTVRLGDRYLMEVKDSFENRSAHPLEIPRHQIQLGAMRNLEGETIMMGFNALSVDSLSPGKKVKHWGGRLNKITKKSTGLARERQERPVDWMAAKNKYFTQALLPDNGGEAVTLYAHKSDASEPIDYVYSSVEFGNEVVTANNVYERNMKLYLGPKKLSELEKMGNDYSRIMEMGYLPGISEIMLKLLNMINGITFGNYGMAIILMTFFLKVLFWPITHRGNESMRRMQEFAPKIKEIGEKYKDNPQKKQTEL
ncbi:MAG: membrane protein insertase YidC, partial [Verrucomicrobiota bacterium]